MSAGPASQEHFRLMQYIKDRYKARNDDPNAIDDVITACERMIEIAPTVVKEMHRAYGGTGGTIVPPRHPGFERLIIIRKKQKNFDEVERLQRQFHDVWGKYTT